MLFQGHTAVVFAVAVAVAADKLVEFVEIAEAAVAAAGEKLIEFAEIAECSVLLVMFPPAQKAPSDPRCSGVVAVSFDCHL